MASKYECPNCGLLEYSDTTSADVPPGRTCGTCGAHVARCVGRR